MTDTELLQQYWDAQAQFGPFEVGPEEYLRRCHESSGDGPPEINRLTGVERL
jgi:hypothetical protein